MADQDSGNADGAAGSEANGRTGSGDSGVGTGTDAANVVPFPRDWFGSVDELVPIDLEPSCSVANDAAAFWDGDAEEIGDPAPSPEARRGDAGASGSGGAASRPIHAYHATEPKRRAFWKPVAAVMLVLVVAGAAVALVAGGGAPRELRAAGPRHPQDQMKTLTETVTAPVTVTTTEPARTRRNKRRAKSPKPTHGANVGATSLPVASHAIAPSANIGVSSQVPARVSSGTKSGSHQSRLGSSSRSSGGCAQSPDSGCLP